MNSMWTLAKLDLQMWLRMPFAMASALIPPIGMTLILYTLSLAVLQQPVALVVKGHGPETDKMQKIIQSDTDAYVNYDFSERLKVVDEQKAKYYLDSQQVAAIISIPADFDQKVKIGKAQVDLLINNVDIDFSDDIRRSVDRSVAHFDAPILSPNDAEEAEVEFDPEQPNPYRITIDEKDLRETNVEWLQYQIIPALILLILNVGLVGTALICAQDIERGTAKILVLSPHSSWKLIFGRMLGGFIATASVLFIALCIFILAGFISPPSSHWFALIVIFILTIVCAVGLGALLGTLLHGSRVIAMAATVVATYMYFLGGGFTTIVFLPEWVQRISQFIPFRYSIDGLRQALFYSTMDGIALDVIILSCTAIVSFILGSWSLRRVWST